MKKIIISIPFLMFLSACSNDFKSTLGLRKDAPDEFTVVSYPPLSVPPEFKLSEPNIDKRSLPTKNIGAGSSYTPEENSLLNKISAPPSQTAVKQSIDEERAAKNNGNSERGFIRSTIHTLNNSDNEPVIDPEQEKERLSKNMKENRPINEGKVETKKPRSVISKIFGK